MDLQKQSVKEILDKQFQHLEQIESKIIKENKIIKRYNVKISKYDTFNEVLDIYKQSLEDKKKVKKNNLVDQKKSTNKQGVATTPTHQPSKYKSRRQQVNQKNDNKINNQKKPVNKSKKHSKNKSALEQNKSKMKSEINVNSNKKDLNNQKVDNFKKHNSKQSINYDKKTMHKRRGTMAESHKIIALNSKKFTNSKTAEQKELIENIDMENGDFFQCDLEEIKGDLDNELDYQQPFDKGARKTMNNFDKMFLLEMMEEPYSEDELQEKNLIDEINPQTLSLYRKFFMYTNQKKENLFKSNKIFFLLWCEKLVKKFKKDLLQIEQEKIQYVQEFGVIAIDQQINFEFSFFSDFYLKQIENEYLKIREDFQSNSILDCYLQIFSAINSQKYTPDQEGVPAMIRDIKSYQPKAIDIECKLNAERLINNEVNIFEPGFAFKKNNLTGYVCHILRDIIFHYGIISNMQHTLPESYNTQQRYKFLIEKKKFMESKLKLIEHVLKNKLQSNFYTHFLNYGINCNQSINTIVSFSIFLRFIWLYFVDIFRIKVRN